jgi:hypothetical protein
MKLQVGNVVHISSAAGRYKAKIVNVTMALAADHKMYEWYTTNMLQEFSSTGERLPKSGYFNENMANRLVVEVV